MITENLPPSASICETEVATTTRQAVSLNGETRSPPPRQENEARSRENGPTAFPNLRSPGSPSTSTLGDGQTAPSLIEGVNVTGEARALLPSEFEQSHFSASCTSTQAIINNQRDLTLPSSRGAAGDDGRRRGSKGRLGQ